ncbi:Uncharacterised protein [Mycobacteroides abscessus subsp. abscessus]|nr:Uncharacterised protein [Mycobacteroides abscessus subsp. abscessus]
MPALSQAFDQPIKRRLRRHRRGIIAAIDSHQCLRNLALQPLHRTRRQISLTIDRLTHRRDHPLIDTTEHRLAPVVAPVNHTQQPITLVGEAAPLQDIAAHLVPLALQLCQLGQFTLAQRLLGWVELRPRPRPRRRPWWPPGQNLQDMALPPASPLDCRLRQTRQRLLRTQRWT